jgi:L-lactate permease
MQSDALRAILASFPIFIMFAALLFIRMKSVLTGDVALIATMALASSGWVCLLNQSGRQCQKECFWHFFL